MIVVAVLVWLLLLILSIVAVIETIGLLGLLLMFPACRRWWHHPAQIAALAAFAAVVLNHPF